jgi:hypothetical protein
MYKRKLRNWGVRKNSRPRAQLPTAVISNQARGSPRYLPQNDVDESLHTLLDLIAPWITQAYSFWASAAPPNHVHCPPRAMYIYNDFARGIAVATAAFETGEVVRGGEMLRQAFLDLEPVLAPRARSVFTLHSLLFALATLSQANLFEASRFLVKHATSLAVLGAQSTSRNRDSVHDQGESGPGQEHDEIALSRHVSHPFPQMLKRLQFILSRLDGDDETMMKIFFLVWSVYHRSTSAASVGTIRPQVSRREYWNTIISAHSFPSSNNNQTNNWIDTMQPILYYLNKLQGYAESNMGIDDDFSLVPLEELVSVYSFGRHEMFEETAMELLGRVEEKKSRSTRAAALEHVSIADLELAAYYSEKGDLEKVVRHFSRIIPEKAGMTWKVLLKDELRRWTQENIGN